MEEIIKRMVEENKEDDLYGHRCKFQCELEEGKNNEEEWNIKRKSKDKTVK